MPKQTHDCAKCFLPIAGKHVEVDELTYHARCAPQYDERCVICQNEGPHDLEDRRHVFAGQE